MHLTPFPSRSGVSSKPMPPPEPGPMKTAADGVHCDDDFSGHDTGGLQQKRLATIGDISDIADAGPDQRSDRRRRAKEAWEIRNIYRRSGMGVVGYITRSTK